MRDMSYFYKYAKIENYSVLLSFETYVSFLLWNKATVLYLMKVEAVKLQNDKLLLRFKERKILWFGGDMRIAWEGFQN